VLYNELHLCNNDTIAFASDSQRTPRHVSAPSAVKGFSTAGMTIFTPKEKRPNPGRL
jgi:hypothetical protein